MNKFYLKKLAVFVALFLIVIGVFTALITTAIDGLWPAFIGTTLVTICALPTLKKMCKFMVDE